MGVTWAYFIPVLRTEMAVTVYFCEVDTLSPQWWSPCHAEPSFTCAVQNNNLIRGAGLVCSLAILENTIPRKTVGLVFDSVNNWPFLGAWEEICLTVGRLYGRDSKLCKSCRRCVDWSCGRVETSRWAQQSSACSNLISLDFSSALAVPSDTAFGFVDAQVLVSRT